MSIPHSGYLVALDKIDDVGRGERPAAARAQVRLQRGGIRRAKGHLLVRIHDPIVVQIHPRDEIAGSAGDIAFG